jgi:serine/threonine-protein kinase
MPACPTCSTQYPPGTAFCAKDGTSLTGDAPSSGAEESLKPGDIVGEYQVEGTLGEGGFGTVYRGIHPMIGKAAAIKVLKREFSAKADMVSRFLAEARAVNQIRHRNIIDIFSFGVLPDGRHYYVMELLDGTTLDRHLKGRGGRVPPDEAIAILRPLARALGAAHGHGIAHRDLKPENVFLTVDDEGRPMPKLLDFGIAKLAGDLGAQHKTRSGIPMGTPSYMSPEQVHGRGVDHRTDIYAFGVVVFEMLTGRLPFDGESMIDVMVKHASHAAPKLTDFVPSIPAELNGPVLQMMAKDPGARFSSITAAMDALTEAAARAGVVEPSKFAPLGAGSGAGAFTPAFSTPSALDFASNAATVMAPSEGGPTLVGTESGTTTGSRSRLPLVAVAVLACAGLGVGGFFALRGGGATASSAAPAVTTASPVVTSVGTADRAPPAPSVEIAPAGTNGAPAVTEITLKLKTQPDDCDVYLGDTRLGSSSEALKLALSKAPVKLSIRKKGFLSAELSVTPERDLAEIVTLKPVPAGKKKDYEW